MPQVDTTSAAARIDSLLGSFAADPVMAERAEDLVRTLVEFYDDGLGRMVELLTERPDGEDILAMVATDKIVAGMLVLHDLHPASTYERVSAALERVRPYLGSHSGDVDLLGVDDDGVVRLRLAGSCNGCPSSTVTVKLAIEQAIEEAAPEVIRVEVEGVAAPPLPRGVGGPGGRTLLPMLGTPASAPSGPTRTWITLGSTSVTPGTLAAMAIGGSNAILANIDGSLYAYRNFCPGCGNSVHTGAIDGDHLQCAGCAERFDLRRAGAGSVRADLHLEPLPLLDEDGTVRVAVPVGSGA
jgi:Fe-S cluster biogenesis protein NfuA/nitrite reductase/ring-hydroxylating ferredoxin subunit